ncbi:MAG: hypothetical protein CNC05_00285 [Pelagibacterales bacterium MED-G42]|nr:MAG: hypothetical protein CNC05_00285 [Pelagibacterales bacterium MED-G42]
MKINDITIGIVLFKSEKVIFNCLKSLDPGLKIVLFDNSNDKILKEKIKKKYPQIKYFLSKKNLGYGCANNKIFKIAKTRFVFIINPDTELKKNCIKNLIKNANKIREDFAIIAPICSKKNYGFFKKKIPYKIKLTNLIQVDWVQGFAMLANVSRLKKINFFDKNIFLYLEEIDLCKRLLKNNERILVSKNSQIMHLSAKSSNIGFEFDRCRNWHYMWSKFYFYRKHYSYFRGLKETASNLIKSLFKTFIYFLLNNSKYIIYKNRLSGLLNSYLNKKSWDRPLLK